MSVLDCQALGAMNHGMITYSDCFKWWNVRPNLHCRSCRHWARTVVSGEVSWLPFKGNPVKLRQSITSLCAQSRFALGETSFTYLGLICWRSLVMARVRPRNSDPWPEAILRPRWAACTWWVMMMTSEDFDSSWSAGETSIIWSELTYCSSMYINLKGRGQGHVSRRVKFRGTWADKKKAL